MSKGGNCISVATTSSPRDLMSASVSAQAARPAPSSPPAAAVAARPAFSASRRVMPIDSSVFIAILQSPATDGPAVRAPHRRLSSLYTGVGSGQAKRDGTMLMERTLTDEDARRTLEAMASKCASGRRRSLPSQSVNLAKSRGLRRRFPIDPRADSRSLENEVARRAFPKGESGESRSSRTARWAPVHRDKAARLWAARHRP